MKLLKNSYFWILDHTQWLPYIASCTRQDFLIVPIETNKAFVATRGTNVHLPDNMTAGNTNEWKFEKTQSRSLWETNHVGTSIESLIRTLSDFKSENLLKLKKERY